MRIITLGLLFIVLLATSSLAKGLEITEIDVNADYDEAYVYRVESTDRKNSAGVSVSNNSKIDVDVLPGSNVTFTVRVENTFQGEEPEIKGVFTRVTIEDVDDGADLEEESLDFDLEPGDDYRFDVKFAIPLDVDAGTYNTVLEAEGEDRNGTSFSTKLSLKFEVKKQSHDIRITNILLNPSFVDCDRKTKLTAEITNAGSNPENQVAVEFKSSNLGINSFDKDIFLESSEDASEDEKKHTKALNFEVPSFLKSGTYPIFVNLYWKNFVLFDQKTADLVVKDCGGASKTETKPEQPKQEPEKETKEQVTVIKPEEKTKETGKEEITTATTEVSVLNSPVFIFMILGGFVIIVLAVLVVVGYLRRSQTQ
ncbi:hypothetical protein HYX02_05520 [Candidatus Woesearchaeota archaeon]|nr:hypothetical protein [Candidatus Woesearchaeota archaeon]